MSKDVSRGLALLDLRSATALYYAAVAAAAKAEDDHAEAEYRLASREQDLHGFLAGTGPYFEAKHKRDRAHEEVTRTAAAARIAGRAVEIALTERMRFYKAYMDLTAQPAK